MSKYADFRIRSKYADFRIRSCAKALDFMIALLIWFVCFFVYYSMYSMVHYIFSIKSEVHYISSIESEDSNLGEMIFSVSMGVLLAALSILCLSSKYQATPGKAMLGIYVGDKDGNRISILRATMRFFLISISFASAIILIIDACVLFFSKEKASLHDKICGTRVFQIV